MKKLQLLFSIPLLLSFFIGCADDETTNPGGNPTAITSVSGSIEGWSFGTGKTIVMGRAGSYDTIGTGRIAANGSFTVNLSGAPMESLLDSSVSFDAECSGNFTSTAAGVMDHSMTGGTIMDGANVFGIAICATSINIAGDTAYSPQLNDAYQTIIYYSKSTTINGSQTCPKSFDGVNNTMVTSVISNLSVVAGWNKLYGKVTVRTPTTVTMEYSITDPGTVKWYFKRIN